MRFTTKAIHAHELNDCFGAVSTPIYQTSNFFMDNDKYLSADRECFKYTRVSNPSNRVVEKKLASLCEAEDGVLLSSGIAAICTTLLSFSEPGDNILFPEKMYGGTFHLIHNHLLPAGIEARFYRCDRPEEIGRLMDERTCVLYAEPVTNPTLELIDIEQLSKIKKHALLVVDNTFLSPFNFHPLLWNADVEIHSVTKYICGHSDVIAGYACAQKKELIEKIWKKSFTLGFTPSPFDAFLVGRGVKTLGLRMERHNDNARVIARFLERVSKEDPTIQARHPTLYNQMPVCLQGIPGYGGIIYLDLHSLDRAKSFVRGMSLFLEATSLAGIESLVTIPCLTSHSSLSEEELCQSGVSKGGVRLSVGIEDVEDLIEDIKAGLRSSGIL